MKKNNSYKHEWQKISQLEKERIFKIFLKKHGKKYVPEDFAEFLRERFTVSDHVPTFSNWRQGF